MRKYMKAAMPDSVKSLVRSYSILFSPVTAYTGWTTVNKRAPTWIGKDDFIGLK